MSKTVGSDGCSFPARRRSCMFHKLMVASILQDKKLKIPEKFVKKYRNELSSTVTLTVPNGHIWLVELQEVDNKLWFQKGWHEFVEHCSINVGYFLVFRYEGKSNFNVNVFNLAVSEINYPLISPPGGVQEPDNDCKSLVLYKEDNLQDVAVTEIFSPGLRCLTYVSSGNKISNEYIYCNLPEFSYYGASTEKQFNGSELMNVTDDIGLLGEAERGPKRRRRRRRKSEINRSETLAIDHKKHISNVYTRRWREVTDEEKDQTIRAAHMFKSHNPFFRVTLRPSYVYRGFLLHVPTSFARVYLRNVAGLITLEGFSGKQWQVRCVYKDGKACFTQGWPGFVWENKLEEDDVCVFELMNAKDIVLKVTIFRVLEDPSPVATYPVDSGGINVR